VVVRKRIFRFHPTFPLNPSGAPRAPLEGRRGPEVAEARAIGGRGITHPEGDAQRRLAARLGRKMGIPGRSARRASPLPAREAEPLVFRPAGAQRATGNPTGCQEAARAAGKCRSALLGRPHRSATRRGTEDARRARAISSFCSIASQAPARGAIRLNAALLGRARRRSAPAPLRAACAARTRADRREGEGTGSRDQAVRRRDDREPAAMGQRARD
jgi:hypothetical protein